MIFADPSGQGAIAYGVAAASGAILFGAAVALISKWLIDNILLGQEFIGPTSCEALNFGYTVNLIMSTGLAGVAAVTSVSGLAGASAVGAILIIAVANVLEVVALSAKGCV